MIDPYDLRVTSYLPQSGHGASGMTVGLSSSGIIVHHIPTGIGVSCDSERSQHANKDKALSILERLVGENMFQDSLSVLWEHAPHLVPTPIANNHNIGPHGVGRVDMIRLVRETLGCGLKKAKDLVDKYYHREDCKQLCIEEYNGGKCVLGDACVCRDDLPQIREGCLNWSKV